MKKVYRFIPAKEAVWRIVFSTCMMTGYPCALLVMIPSVMVMPYLLRKREYLALMFFFVTWAWATVPLLCLTLRRLRHRIALGNMVALLCSPECFNPRAHQVRDTRRGQYFGVDTDHGTLLIIHRVKKDVTRVAALTMDDWTECEHGSGCLRIHTRMADLPVLCVYDHPSSAGLLSETLKAMRHRRYPKHVGMDWLNYVRRQSSLIRYAHKVIVVQEKRLVQRQGCVNDVGSLRRG